MRLTEVNNKVFLFLHGILQETQKWVSVNLVCKEQQRKNDCFFFKKANLHCKLGRSVLALKRAEMSPRTGWYRLSTGLLNGARMAPRGAE